MSQFLSPSVKGSVNEAIDAIRQSREKFLSHLLTDQGLASFLETHYDTILLSPIRTEFLKRDIKELKSSAMDLTYFAPLIKELKEKEGVDIINHPLVIAEVKALYEKYRY